MVAMRLKRTMAKTRNKNKTIKDILEKITLEDFPLRLINKEIIRVKEIVNSTTSELKINFIKPCSSATP